MCCSVAEFSEAFPDNNNEEYKVQTGPDDRNFSKI